MQRIVAAVSLVATASILSGCGGGGQDFSKPCMTSTFTLVSQSMAGELDAMTKTSVANASMKPLKMKVVEKFDVDKVTMRQEMSRTVTATVNGKDIEANVEMKMVFDAAKKSRVTYSKITADGNESTTCKTLKYQNLPDADTLAREIKAGVAMLGGRLKCVGSDGTYDNYVMDLKIPDPTIPVPLPIPLDSSGALHWELRMNKDFMLGSMKSHIDAATQGMATSIDGLLIVDGGAGTSGGPTDVDLDTSSWGKCPEELHTSEVELKEAFFEPTQHSIYTGFLLQIMNVPTVEDNSVVSV